MQLTIPELMIADLHLISKSKIGDNLINTQLIKVTDLFLKCHRLFHNGRYPKFETLYLVSLVNSTEILIGKSLLTRYNLPSHKVSYQFKNFNSFSICLPLWTSHTVAMHDDIGNRSATFLEINFNFN